MFTFKHTHTYKLSCIHIHMHLCIYICEPICFYDLWQLRKFSCKHARFAMLFGMLFQTYIYTYKQIYIYKYWPLHTICFIACQRKICPCCQTFERIWYVYNIYKYICIYVKQNLCFLSAFLVFIVGGAQKCRKTAILLCCLRFLNIFENVYRNTYIHIY